jgi:N-methylhydantoinase A
MSPRNHKPELRIAIDTGGTFTDCVWRERGRTRMMKVFSTPADPSQAIVEVLEKIGASGDVTILHGTTVGTNTILQRKGARVALVTTSGFEHAIEIGRQARPKLYDFFFDRVEPLVPADLRFGIEERTASDGEILQAPTRNELQALLSNLRRKRPEAIAVSFLFSFANPKNELAVADALRSLGVPLSISHQILPEFREYERTSTVVMNAYLQPVMQRYLERLEQRVKFLTRAGAAKSSIFVMQSGGGITTLSSAASQPVRTILSGPAGGVVGASAMARRSGFERMISFDMGGTSTDVSLVKGEVLLDTQSAIAGLPVGVPMLDIHTVGAGGGSIARFDVAGALRVGPESAGADPGPICYGRGTQPTVTDANLLLGRLQSDRFLGGDFVIDLDRTRRITSAWLTKQRSTFNLAQFAAGVVKVVNATMEKAIRVVSIERGHDPRDFALVAFGGAGGLHACELAESLAIPRVIVPALPGALSAYGILLSDVVKDYSRTVVWRCSNKPPLQKLENEFSVLQRRAEAAFREEIWHGKIRLNRSVDVRYRGQGYELNVPFGSDLIRAFHRAHQLRYGYNYAGRGVELVTLRLRARIRTPKSTISSVRVALNEPKRVTQAPHAAKIPVTHEGTRIKASLHAREELRVGRRYSGPAIITEYSATTFVLPKMHFWLDRAANLVIETRRSATIQNR